MVTEALVLFTGIQKKRCTGTQQQTDTRAVRVDDNQSNFHQSECLQM